MVLCFEIYGTYRNESSVHIFLYTHIHLFTHSYIHIQCLWTAYVMTMGCFRVLSLELCEPMRAHNSSSFLRPLSAHWIYGDVWPCGFGTIGGLLDLWGPSLDNLWEPVVLIFYTCRIRWDLWDCFMAFMGTRSHWWLFMGKFFFSCGVAVSDLWGTYWITRLRSYTYGVIL